MEPEICLVQNKRVHIFRSGLKKGHTYYYASWSVSVEKPRSPAERGAGGKPKIPGGVPWGAQR